MAPHQLAPHRGPSRVPGNHGTERAIENADRQLFTTSVLDRLMERIHPKPRLPRVRKQLVEADGCFLTREVDPFTTRKSRRFLNERAADAATAKARADRKAREECMSSERSDCCLGTPGSTPGGGSGVRHRPERTPLKGDVFWRSAGAVRNLWWFCACSHDSPARASGLSGTRADEPAVGRRGSHVQDSSGMSDAGHSRSALGRGQDELGCSHRYVPEREVAAVAEEVEVGVGER